jgi:hypothetical protein
VTNEGAKEAEFNCSPAGTGVRFRARSQDGAEAFDPFWNVAARGLPYHEATVAPGGSTSLDLDLRDYLAFPATGTYVVSGSLEEDAPTSWIRITATSCVIEILPIDSKEAKRQVRALLGEDDGEFGRLGHPVYLPELLAWLKEIAPGAEGRDWRDRLFDGIDSVRTPEGIAALLTLASDEHPAVRVEALRRLKDRLPYPKWGEDPDRIEGWPAPPGVFPDDARAKLRDLCLSALEKADPATAGAAALCLAHLHDAGCVPRILAAGERAFTADPTAETDGFYVALNILRMQGAALPELPAEPSRARLFFWARTLAWDSSRWSAGAADRVIAMIRGTDKALRWAVAAHLDGLARLRPDAPIAWDDLLEDPDYVIRLGARNAVADLKRLKAK